MADKIFTVEVIETIHTTYVIRSKDVADAFDEVLNRDSGLESDYFPPFSRTFVGEHILQAEEIDQGILDQMTLELSDSNDSVDGYVRTIVYK